MKVSMMIMEPQMNLIITGSEDKSLFFFKFITNEKGIDMNPIRSVKLDYVAINFEWLSYEVRTVNFKKINVLVLINKTVCARSEELLLVAYPKGSVLSVYWKWNSFLKLQKFEGITNFVVFICRLWGQL